MRVIVILLVLLVAGAFASPPAEQAADSQSQGISDSHETPGLVKKLSHLIDLWHDANLKGEGNLILQRSDEIVKLLRTDIRHQQLQVDQMRVRLTGMEDNTRGGPPTLAEKQLLDSLSRADDFLKVRKRLLGAFTRSQFFSNKYRLLGDYVDILQLEQDQRRPAIADSEVQQDEGHEK